jgi:Holliday junction DNA helicase RuvB
MTQSAANRSPRPNSRHTGNFAAFRQFRRVSASEKHLYPAMEDFEVNIVVGKGPGARTMKLSVFGK